MGTAIFALRAAELEGHQRGAYFADSLREDDFVKRTGGNVVHRRT